MEAIRPNSLVAPLDYEQWCKLLRDARCLLWQCEQALTVWRVDHFCQLKRLGSAGEAFYEVLRRVGDSLAVLEFDAKDLFYELRALFNSEGGEK